MHTLQAIPKHESRERGIHAQRQSGSIKHLLTLSLSRVTTLALVFAVLFNAIVSFDAHAQNDRATRPRRATDSPAPTGKGASNQPQQSDNNTPRTNDQPSQENTRRASGASNATGNATDIEDDDEVVRVETELVTVPVTVTNRAGQFITNLSRDNFTVYEDGKPQVVSDFARTEQPFEVALLLDTSGSTRNDLQLIRRAATAFIEGLRAGDRVSVLGFNTAGNEDAKLATVEIKTALTDDRRQLARAIETIGASNGTPFYDSLNEVASKVFRDEPRAETLRGGVDAIRRRAVVALTDGVDSTSNAEFAEARAKLLRQGIVCYFVQLNTEEFVEERLLRDCNDAGTVRLSRTQLARYRRIFAPFTDAGDYADFCRLGTFARMEISRTLYKLAAQEMTELARSSGGRVFPVADLRDASRAFGQVAQEIGTQYNLGYYSTNKTKDGRFRRIRVELRRADKQAQVRAREGYYAKGN